MRLLVLTRRQVEDGAAEGADAVISIRGHNARNTKTLDAALDQAVLGEVDRVLRLTFDDIGIPSFGPQRGPGSEHVNQVVDFGRLVRASNADPLITVHCEMGRSRSTAVGLALLADGHGPGREMESVSSLLRLDAEGIMVPNPRLVRLADEALWRYGVLETAMVGASPAFAAARQHWQQVSLAPEEVWAAARRKRDKRKQIPRDVWDD